MANFFEKLGNTTADLLANSDFINRSVGMANSYEDIMFIVQSLGREPISLLGKDYLYIFDHVRRNYSMGTNIMNPYHNDCPKFTFYKERPTVRFANPYDDPMNLLDRWMPDAEFESTSQRNILYSYAESNDGYTNNKEIGVKYDIENANPGVNFGGISSFSNVLPSCDMIKKTNDNFNHGKYKTIIARFHTDSMDSKAKDDITQSAISSQFGMSHGRNLLKLNVTHENGYDNPYCRVWTYHHQYNQIARAIRPFEEADTAEELESMESGDYNTVGFRTIQDKTFKFDGGSKRLDKYGVLNYRNNLVNIAPTAKIKDYFEHKEDKEVSIKKCMFSIENLAWKSENIIHDEYDQMGLSPEQKGPLGGRIMWFPPYDLTFSEDVRVNWNSNQFIGRGEKVYTYTDTERSGNLSFMLLIDHPSILDYWTGHKRNGMKNQGVELIPGNGGGVDERYNQENTLLRFFAGCDILSAKPQEYRQRVIKPEEVPNPPEPPAPDPPEEEVHKKPTAKAIHCVLYYPNNYSGVDDMPTSNSRVNAIYYLMNGIGTQKFVNDNNVAEDIETQIDSRPGKDGTNHGGYEINGNISIATKNLVPNYEVIKKTYSDTVSKERKAQYLTNSDGTRDDTHDGGYVVSYGGKDYTLAKIVGSAALSLSAARNQSNLTGKSHLWYRRRWYYRVDKVYENQMLSRPDSYLDTECEDLNCKNGYEKVRNHFEVAEAFGIPSDNEGVTLISFADMFVALEGEKAERLITESNYDVKNVEIVKDIINNRDKYKIKEIRYEGHASFQGYSEFNNALSSNRARTLKKWMIGKFPNAEDGIEKIKKERKGDNIDRGSNSTLRTKLWRSASVIIEYDEYEFNDASLAESQKATVDSDGNVVEQLVKTEIPNKNESKAPTKSNSPYQVTNDTWNDIYQKKSKEDKIKFWKSTGITDEKFLNELSWDFDNRYLQNQTGIIGVKSGIVERYDNEGEFFELLEKNDPFMHHLITDKIRYFDPAYHSISPEGFNARLTFLHQCTRQGSTVGGSDDTPGTAYNLAFGRPPVCVLRLGDFFYTKIVINSLNIQYDSPQWDLNPEGIGVMPMFAKVSINFSFLGGSDLAGPISRLQNAVSFNYYANTGVYDNRAEMVEYDSNGSGHEVKFKPYSYPNMLHGYDKFKKQASVSFGDFTTTEFAGRTTNLNNGTSGEIYTYQNNNNRRQ